VSEEEPAPLPPVQRVTFGGVAATLSTVSALLVALASMFTAVQAMNISQSAAQQTLFQNQLDACLALNTVSSETFGNNDEVFELLEDRGPEYDEAEAEELRKTLVVNETLLTAVQREYAKLSMLLPSKEVYDTVFAAQEVHFELHNLAWDMMVARRMTPEGLKRFEALMTREDELLSKASTGCGRYVRRVVNGGRIDN
jgi:hypothetical protein